MKSKRFFQFFAAAAVLQLFLLLGGYALLFGPSGGEKLRDSMLIYAYAPFIELIIKGGGYGGEASMIWPPVYGALVGILFYSALIGVIAIVLARKK